jgi:mono/diheme cytochrome c family protein
MQSMMPVSFFAASIAVLALAACTTTPAPEYSGDPIAGLDVAQNLCATCHAIGRDGASPNAGAPPFRHILSKYDADRLVEDLEESVSISHLRMPTFYFGEHHAADVVAYLQTIQQPSP